MVEVKHPLELHGDWAHISADGGGIVQAVNANVDGSDLTHGTLVAAADEGKSVRVIPVQYGGDVRVIGVVDSLTPIPLNGLVPVRVLGIHSAVRVYGAVTAGQWIRPRQEAPGGRAEGIPGSASLFGAIGRALGSFAGPEEGTVPVFLFAGKRALHAADHWSGQSDPLRLDDLAAPEDNTDLNATAGQHGLLPKLAGGTAKYLRADGTWVEPPITDYTVKQGYIPFDWHEPIVFSP